MEACLATLIAAASASAAYGQQPSGYTPFKGEQFFLLSDAAYGSKDVARVRLEVAGREASRGSLEAYSGVDIAVYRVPAPLDFLKKQSNLHRVQVTGNFQGEGLANTLSFLWDSWWKQSRLAWRQIFSSSARLAVTQTQPALATNGEAIKRPTEFRNNPQYQPLKGYELVERFRYPMWQAKPVEPPKGVKLDGSSSDFIKKGAGNLMIPIGSQKPGLYLVEAVIGQHRATALVFVSDTVAITKIASGQMLVWTAHRDNGAVVPGVKLAWTDGTGVLRSGTTGDNGVATLERSSPEHTYVLGEDPSGGVFVSENFYYDSEIYNTKIYAVTDRPLYRPGDEVNVKFIGREFKSARISQAASAGELQLTVIDPNGTPLLTQKLQLTADSGADTRFKLPENATAGGYELRLSYRDTQYGAAFRVAEYVKPHFEINVLPGKPEFKTGELVSGKIQLAYPDGKPVRNAKLSLSLRAQKNTMVEGELRYSGLFPVQLKTMELVSGSDGSVSFSLPEAKDPSRYILTVLASDGAAYRVKTTRELMIERSASAYRLKAQSQFSNPNESVRFELIPEGQSTAKPVRWEMVQLEKQQKTEGAFDSGKAFWDVNFPASGSYTLSLRDEHNNILAAISHWVSGDGLKATPGSIEIVPNHERYKLGDTAEVLITFSEPVEQALLTLERDKVEQVGLLKNVGNSGADWIKPSRVAPNQWRASIPVKEDYGPNITFSVAYAKNGDYVFQNQGLQIVQPQIVLQFKADKDVYQPGEKVTLDVMATFEGKPVATMLALGVVDEMIYVLQPEIAPEIGDFFYHPRRNNVRTTSSLAFISYDQSQGLTKGTPGRHNYNERGVKILERPRRDNIDTAFWQPSLKTDATGRAQVSFTMPDSLTRWRITGRAIDAQGMVGQKTGYLRSDKAFYAKWTSPDWMRVGDLPQAAVAVFNQTAEEQAVEVTLNNGTLSKTEKLAAKRGINYVGFPLAASAGPLRLEVRQNGKLVDVLETPLKTQPLAWSSPRVLVVPIAAASNAISLPADAVRIRVSFAQGAAAHFARIADDLIEYPYGCVEQTASRLIPLAMGVQNIGPESGRVQERLASTLQAQRLRLVSMAGPKAVFGWWGNATAESALMTGYAYYADWYAARALQIEMPPEHWAQMLTAYQKLGAKETPLHRALILWMAQEMGLPVKTLTSGLLDQLVREAANDKAIQYSYASSVLLGANDDRNGQAFALALASVLAAQNELALPSELQARVNAAWETLKAHPAPVAQALRMLGKRLPAAEADNVLSKVRADMPTMDRALALVWTQKSLGGIPGAKAPLLALDAPWEKSVSSLGQPLWRWPEGRSLPTALQPAQSASGNTVAIIQYESRALETPALPVQVQRRILRMIQDPEGFTTELLGDKDKLRTDELYLDEIVLKPAAGATYRYGLLEVPLPPGASVETGTWGIKIKAEKIAPLERARQESTRDGYVVPVEPLSAEVTVRHLLRFAQKGSFNLPPARFYRMYQPEQKAFEADGKTARSLRVE
jgi:uncharacterized protein YfaS (alpha-2-macroglobulin family)